MSMKRLSLEYLKRIDQCLYQEMSLTHLQDYRFDFRPSRQLVTIQLVGLNPHYLKGILSRHKELKMFLGLDQSQDIRLIFGDNRISIEVPKPKDYWLPVTIEGLARNRIFRQGSSIVLGLDTNDAPALVDFNKPDRAHMLVAGQTGSGKTNTIRLAAWELAHHNQPDKVGLVLIDVAKRGRNWRDFENSIHLACPIIKDTETAEAVLQWLLDEIGERGEKDYVTPRLVVIIDELKALTDDSKRAQSILEAIAERGRELGINLIVASQYPTIKALGDKSNLKRNLTVRLCGKVDDAIAANNTLGVPESGAEALAGYGDFLMRDSEGLKRLLTPLVNPSHMNVLKRGESRNLINLSRQATIADPKVLWPRSTKHESMSPFAPQELAISLYSGYGINKLRSELNTSTLRAREIRNLAQEVREYGKQFVDKIGGYANFLSGEWIEV